MTEHERSFQLSDLEAWILDTIDNTGWYAYLWFPVVYREVLNFGPEGSDEEVDSAFAGLVRKGALQMTQAKWGDIPEWKPDPGALGVAKDVLRSKFGWPDSYKPPERH